jgi:predicted RNase H-like nuclease (RuvC/YqgF family)
MTQAILVALLGGLLGGGAVAALITTVANRAKIRAETESIFIKAAKDLVRPLQVRLDEYQRDNETLKEISRRQSDSYDRLEAKYDQVMYELRAVRADRDNLLAERIIYQKRIDAQAETIKCLELRVAELERELASLQRGNSGAGS